MLAVLKQLAVHLHGSAPGQLSSEETSQRCRAVVDTVSDLIDPEIKPLASRTIAVFLATTPTARYNVMIETKLLLRLRSYDCFLPLL